LVGRSFRWKNNHKEISKLLKIVYRIRNLREDVLEDDGKIGFPLCYLVIIEGIRVLDESNPLECIDIEIKMEEFDI